MFVFKAALVGAGVTGGEIAQIIAADGKPVGGNGPPTIATNWIDDPELGWLTLAEGRAPTAVPDGAPLEVVIDVGTAEDEHFAVGDPAEVRRRTTALLARAERSLAEDH